MIIDTPRIAVRLFKSWGLARGVAFILALGPSGVFCAEPAAQTVAPLPVHEITLAAQIFDLSTEEKAAVHPIRIEGRVSYYDRRWRHLWLENDGLGVYVMLASNPPALVQGQRVRIEGTFIPSKGLEASSVIVTALPLTAPEAAMDGEGRICDFITLNSRRVMVHAFVEAQRLLDDDHLRLALVVDDQPVIAWVKPQDPHAIPDFRGEFIKMSGLYQGRLDPTQTQMTVELWTALQSDVEILGSIQNSHRFEIAQTPINQLYLTPLGKEVRIRGFAQSDQPGSELVIRDNTGQVVVHSVQQERVQPGTEIEAVGLVSISSAQWNLQSALFRAVRARAGDLQPVGKIPSTLTRVDEIRQLDIEVATKRLPVDISGTVTWAQAGENFFFIEDITGGIRVRFRPDQLEAPQRTKYLRIKGVTYAAGFSAAVELQQYEDLGAMSPPPVKEISYAQAISGQEDGQLVDMLGFYDRTESDSTVRRIHLTTPGGDFVALLVSQIGFAATPGSLVRIRGVCEAVEDVDGKVTTIVLRTPSLPEVIVEHDAPADFYSLPLRSIKDVRHIGSPRDLTRVHVSGTVLYSEAGRLLYLQEGSAALLVLSSETQPLALGDRIEAVGILGSEGVRPVLRAAAFRKMGVGAPVAPVAVSDPAHLLVALDSHLVSMRGTLIDTIVGPEMARFTLQSGKTVFEAVLNRVPGQGAPTQLDPGSVLEATGICKMAYDDSRQSRGFQLQLRSMGDIAVVQKARLWALGRSLVATATLGGCTLLVLGWVTALRRRVRRQTEQIREQLERQARLESELQHAARLESLGVLAGGIAHDFNNLLTVIMGNVSFVMLDQKVMAVAGDLLNAIKKGATQARDLTQQLLTFAKGGSPLRSTVSLTHIVRDTTEFILRGSNVRSEFDFPDDLWNASVDKDQTAQVIQNLVLNAAQAMPTGGIVRILLRNDTIAAGFNAALTPGRYIRLTIADSGEGISPDILPRIFEPYFSTKASGNGLGLATVYSVVKKHQGHIEVASTSGRGTAFTAWLPAADPTAVLAPIEAVTGDPVVPEKTARVLLMDDDAGIRRICGIMLKHMGLEATLVSDGAEAISRFVDAQDEGRPFDLLILDLTIPGGMGGKETIETIRKLDYNVPAIVSSGYSNDPVLADFRRAGFQAMVSKPYEVNQMAKAIRELLAQNYTVPSSVG